MDEELRLRCLLDLVEELGIAVRRAPAAVADSEEHPGGAIVRLKGAEVLFLNSDAPLADQIEALAGALRGRPQLQDRFLPPEIRAVIDSGSL